MQLASTELAARLRQHRRRITPQRALVCRLLDGSVEHPSAEALYRRATVEMPTLSLRTVYSILHELVELGAVQPLDLGTGSVRFDPDTRPHHHAVCTRCGRVRDVHLPVPHIELPPDQQKGFWVCGVDLIFRGICRECRR